LCHNDKTDEDVDPAKVIITTCNHIFHRKCLKQWVKEAVHGKDLDNKQLCPVCRTKIVAWHGEGSKPASQETNADFTAPSSQDPAAGGGGGAAAM